MRLEAIQTALQAENLDGWLFFDHHQRDPLAYSVLGLPTVNMASRRWYYLIPAHGEPRKLVHRIESGILETLPGSKAVYSGWDTQRNGLKTLLAGCKTVAMQYSPLCAVPYVAMVDAGTVELIRENGVSVVTSANLIQLFEARWTEGQLQTHLEAGRLVDKVRAAAFTFIGDSLRAGRDVTEWQVNRFIREGFHNAGLVTDHGPIVAVNAHMSDPHYEPHETGSAPIRPGDAVLIDLWAKLDETSAVYYDITWTGFCGEAVPEKLQEIFEVVTSGRDRAIEKVQAAVASRIPLKGFEVDDAARQSIAARGYGEYFVHRTGHSIGESVHGNGANMDNLETHDERQIIANTCFSIEPGVYLPEFGIRSEIDMYVRESEAIVTGEIQRELVKIL